MVNNASLEFSKHEKQFFMQIAAWLIDNTGLTFEQIAQCCKLAINDVQDIADEEIEVEKYNPVASGIITEREIDDCNTHPNQIPKLTIQGVKKRNRIVGIARRRDKPDAVFYLIKRFPILDDNIVAKLISTTNYTVEQIRNGSHHNMQNIKPQDPVLLGLCSQKNLEAEIEKAEIEAEKQERLRNIRNNYFD